MRLRMMMGVETRENGSVVGIVATAFVKRTSSLAIRHCSPRHTRLPSSRRECFSLRNHIFQQSEAAIPEGGAADV
jgi:hypothetical protein